MSPQWLAYNQLAWTEAWLADPAGYQAEADNYLALLRQHGPAQARTLLHLGSGAGGLDTHLRAHYAITGVDLSPGMLALARAAHPEIEYIQADMRRLDLGRQFDLVVIPDSIDYMASLDDLRLAIGCAKAHLRPDGLLLITAKTTEIFRNNNFAYSGEKDGIHITLLENNYILPAPASGYEATLIYLIRRQLALEIYTDRHQLGLFSQADWAQVFRAQQLEFSQHPLHGLYDPYLLSAGEYPMWVFLAKKLPRRA